MPQAAASLEHAIARWNAGDLDGYLDLYAPSIRLHGYSAEPMTKEQVADFYRLIFASLPAAGGPGPKLEILDIVADGDRLACRFAMSGSHSGNFMGVRPTGRPYVLNGITILHFSGDTVIERWSQADMLGLLVQLGALPPPGQTP